MSNNVDREYDRDLQLFTSSLQEVSGQIKNFKKGTEDHILQLQHRLQNTEQVVATLENRSGGSFSGFGSVASIGDAVCQKIGAGDADQFAQLASGNTSRASLKLSHGIRAALTHSNGGSSSNGGNFPSQPENGNVFGAGIRRLSLLDALPSRPTTRDAIEFVRITADSDAGVQVLEGDEKAEIEIEGALVRAEIATIAGHTTASKQVLADSEALASVIDRTMRGRVMSKAEAELVTGDGTTGHIEGILTQAVTYLPSIASEPADIIGECLATMTDDGYNASFVLLNPMDWFRLQTERTTPAGDYLFGSPAAPIAPSLWNTPVVLSSSVPQGTGVVIDTAYVTVLDRQNITVEASQHHKDNFTKNLVTIRAEARIGLEISDQFAVRMFDLEASST